MATMSTTASSRDGVTLTRGRAYFAAPPYVASRTIRSMRMSRKRRGLLSAIDDLNAASSHLRGTLQQYERAMTKIGRRLEAGEPAISAGKGTDVPAQRKQVTEGIEEFEAARHHLRVALLAAAQEEGASASDVARVLGVSRQLISRIGIQQEL